jgi:hypothetical protein
VKKIFCIIILNYIIFLLVCSCSRDTLQEECDSQSTVEYFLEYYKPDDNGVGIKYRFNFDYNSNIFIDKNYSIYHQIKDIEYSQYLLSHKDDSFLSEEISLIYGSAKFKMQNFVLFSDLERVCVYQYYDGHIDFHCSYRYYKIKKTDGLKIMEIVKNLGNDKNETD